MALARHACPTCDTLFSHPDLETNAALWCSRCGHRLTTRRAEGFQWALALSAAALLLLIVSAVHPFLEFSASGRAITMTLLDSATSLFEHREAVLGSVVFALIFAGPLALLICQLVVLLTVLNRVHTPWLVPIARALHALRTWNMIEVFLISVFVSAAKLASMANLELGVAFFSFVAFTLCTLVSVHLVDTVQLWRRIEALQT